MVLGSNFTRPTFLVDHGTYTAYLLFNELDIKVKNLKVKLIKKNFLFCNSKVKIPKERQVARSHYREMEGRDVGGENPPPSDPIPLTGGEFLLQLLHRPPQSTTLVQTLPHNDPAAMVQVNPPFLPSTFNFSELGSPQFYPSFPWILPHQNTAGISLPHFPPPPPGFAHSQLVPVDLQRGIFPRGSSEAFLPGENQQLGFRNEEFNVGGRRMNSIDDGQLGTGGSQGKAVGGSHVSEHTMNSVGFGQFTYNETDQSHLNDRGQMVLSSLRDQGNQQLGVINKELEVEGRGGNLSNWKQKMDSKDYGKLGAGSSQGSFVGGASVSNHTMGSGGVGFGQFAHNETDGSHLNDGHHHHLNDRGKMVLPSLKSQLQHNAQRMAERRPHELQNQLKESSGDKGLSNSPTRRQNANHGDGMVNELKYALPQFGCFAQPENLQKQLNRDHKINHAGGVSGNDRNLYSESQFEKHEVKKVDGEGISGEKQDVNENCLEKDALVKQLEDSLAIVEEQAGKSELNVNGSQIKVNSTVFLVDDMFYSFNF